MTQIDNGYGEYMKFFELERLSCLFDEFQILFQLPDKLFGAARKKMT